MKFWERFSKNLYKIAAQPQINKVRPKLIEAVLAKSLSMLDNQRIEEIRTFILNKQTSEGGFSDRGGMCDLYYTLFGYYVAESLSVTQVMEPLRKYVATTVALNKLSGVYRYCGAILYAKLIGIDASTEKLRKQIVTDLTQKDLNQSEYSEFLGILALYYLEDFKSIRQIVNQHKHAFSIGDNPCPVIAANAVMQAITGSRRPEIVDTLSTYYRGNGGFAALHMAPCEDLLSTAVALYALHFLDADIRIMKPDCLIFIDDLYDNGGFRATKYDSITDVEYTFYGLLALGSMS